MLSKSNRVLSAADFKSAVRRGKRVYAPHAVVEHSGGHSTEAESKRMVEAHHASAYRFLSQKYSGPLLLPLRLVLRAGLGIRTRLQNRG